jgi:hypothetical protein
MGDVLMTVLLGVMSLGTLAAFVASLSVGRARPSSRAPWIAALVLAIGPAAIFTLVAIGALMNGEGWWLGLGWLGLCALAGLSFTRPRWAMWAFASSAVLLALATGLGAVVLPDTSQLPIDLGRALGFYVIRALVTAALLWWATRARGAGGRAA